MRKSMIFLVGMLIVLMTACQSGANPEEVVLSQMDPINSGDIDTAIALYAPDAFVTIQPALGPGAQTEYRGQADLRAWLEGLNETHFEIDLEVIEVDGNTVTTKTETWNDPTRALGVAPLVATEVYHVEDGVIQDWSWTLSDESLVELQAASTVMAQIEPWNAGDIAKAMELYAEDAVVKFSPVLTPGSPDQYSGTDELQAWFEELKTMNFELKLEIINVDGNVVTTRTETWVDPTRQLGIAPLVATEVYTVENGQIQGWTWTLSDESLAEFEAAIAALPTPINLTFEGDSCSYAGPMEISAGRVTLSWDIQGIARDGYGVALVSLDEGKTFEDLDAWASTASPPWSSVHTFRDRSPSDTSVREGEIYGVCFTASPQAKVGVVGPIVVTK